MWTLALQLALFAAPEEAVPTVAHWELDGTLASAVGGEALTVAPPESARFERVTFDGTETEVLRVEPGGRVHVPIAFTLRGPGYEGRWTVVMDVMIGEPPSARAGARRKSRPPAWKTAPLVQTDPWNDDGAELVADRARGLGLAGAHGGVIDAGVWHRVAMVVDEADKTVSAFVDGVMVRRVRTEIVDSRWALEPELLLFADDERPHPGVRLASLQVRTGAMRESHVQHLGAARAAGLPRPEAPLLAWSSPPPAALSPGQPFVTRFRVSPPAGEVELVLRGAAPGPGDESATEIILGRVACDAGQVHGALAHGLTPGRQQLELRWVADPSRKVSAPIEVLPMSDGADPGDVVGRELLHNGGFDQAQLGPWVLTGDAVVASAAGAEGLAVSGRRGDYALRQVVALPAAVGDAGFAVSASARVRRKDGRGRFGDRGTLLVRFLGADGASLASLRSLSVDGAEWHELAARGPLPPGARQLEVTFNALEREGGKNEVALDRISLALAPIETGPVRLSKLPVLMPGQGLDELVLVFETDRANVAPLVVWGPQDPADGPSRALSTLESTSIDKRHQVHRAVLGPLARGVRYAYRIELAGEASPTWRFRAPAPDTEPLTIAWLADNQHGWSTFRQVIPLLAGAAPDLVIMPGDIVQRGHELREWQTEWFSPLSLEGFAQSTPIAVARGNHDGDGALAHAYVPLPGNGHWYAFTRAGVRFIVLDSEADARRVPEQTSWLEAELAGADARQAPLRVVTFHKAPFTNRWDSPRSRYDGEKWVRDAWVPVFERGGVDLVIAGHAHTYQRMDRNGVRYLVVGGAGGRLDRHVTGRWPMDRDHVGHHYALMRVERDAAATRITWIAKDFQGNVIDRWELASRARAER